VATDAEIFHLCLRQDNFPILRRFVADIAELFPKRRMQEHLHQLGLRRLVWIVAGNTISFAEGLSFVSFHQALVFRVMTVEAKGWRGLAQMKCKLGIRLVARFVRDVTGVASQIERVMPAAALGRIEACLVAVETKIFGGRSPGAGLQ